LPVRNGVRHCGRHHGIFSTSARGWNGKERFPLSTRVLFELPSWWAGGHVLMARSPAPPRSSGGPARALPATSGNSLRGIVSSPSPLALTPPFAAHLNPVFSAPAASATTTTTPDVSVISKGISDPFACRTVRDTKALYSNATAYPSPRLLSLAHDMATQDKPSLLSLPPEIRENIYRLLLHPMPIASMTRTTTTTTTTATR